MQEAIQTQSTKPLLYPKPPVTDEERVNEIFKGIEEAVGFVPDGLRLYGISPPLLENYVRNIVYFNQGGTSLPRALCVMIRYLVSWNAGCSFCIDLNEAFLSSMNYSLDEVRAARNNPDLAPLEKNERALLKLAVRSVDEPDNITEADMENVRNYGWSDREIFDAVAQAASNRSFNSVLRTFKVEHQGAFA
jgi:uncharacterized peroxidase-related enzyme